MSANSFKIFQDLVVSGKKEPSRSNLYGVKVYLPNCLLANSNFVNKDRRDAFMSNNYLADQVSIPGKRIQDTQVAAGWQGAAYSMARGQQNGELDITFLSDKQMWHRQFFEQWMNYAAPDMENRSTLYDEYTTNIMITKWEIASPVSWEGITDIGQVYQQRMNAVTGVWQFFAAWPYDMAGMTFQNGPTNLVKFSTKFKFERYRFDQVGAETMGPNAPDRYVNSATEGIGSVGIPSKQQDAAQFGV
tara:strand:+ start:2821 stop:3558 length:738 start_codon:yes stop_codon:yes gene_type:complete